MTNTMGAAMGCLDGELTKDGYSLLAPREGGAYEWLAGWVYFAKDGPQFVTGGAAGCLTPPDIERCRLLPLSRVPLWIGQKPFAHFYRGPSFIGFISANNQHLDQSFKCEPVYLLVPIDPLDEPAEIEYLSWLDVLRAGGSDG